MPFCRDHEKLVFSQSMIVVSMIIQSFKQTHMCFWIPIWWTPESPVLEKKNWNNLWVLTFLNIKILVP